ncbi:DUF502 domain-containing protein [Candidatus Babeliales bacterium]|nr:DUF502 domain-containing protein [Candidatus Babeliales bacterium]
MENKGFFSRLFSATKSLFLNGLFAILPFAATIFFITFAYNFMTRWLAPLRRLEPTILQQIPGSEFILFIIFIMLVGILLRFLIIHPIIHWGEKIIRKIPIINSVYSGAKTLVDFFNFPDATNVERKVVLIKYPKNEYYNIAFLLGTAANTFEPLIPEDQRKPEEYFKVFMPNTPNPSSGYFFILPKSELIETNISFEEAIKTIVSCGLIAPESLKR